ncbi:MAG: acetate--CoA ligase family protein [Planctomycetota bacterium]|nr:acetate--CoA ligase family protein [Planctomycetota bacterium]
MARLHEYQGKALLKEQGIEVPEGRAVRTPEEAADVARELNGPVVLKVQAWTTSRKAQGGVVFVDSPEEAQTHAANLLGMTFGNFPVTEVLVEQIIDIKNELFVSLSIDDAAQAPILLLDFQGGSGIEERADQVVRMPIDVIDGLSLDDLRNHLQASTIEASFHDDLVKAIQGICEIAKKYEARSVEVNPLVTTNDGRVVAADCRLTIDDYAVFRHPELGIEIARELDHPATELERLAYDLEQADHRGTFYFAQLPTAGAENTNGIIGFHGAGGGGSMMSMDAVTNVGFTLANFCDTSGNPSAAKVYRAARVILAQPDLVGYFGSGSGVASQEQFWSAYGLAKAFIEMNIEIPVVVRLGGNSEDRAVDILHDACADLPATIEGYKKDDTPQACAERFKTLVEQAGASNATMSRSVPDFVGCSDAYSFEIEGGQVWIDHEACDANSAQQIVDLSNDLLKLDDEGKPVLAISDDDIAKKDSELIALEIETRRAGIPYVFVDLAIVGLD